MQESTAARLHATEISPLIAYLDSYTIASRELDEMQDGGPNSLLSPLLIPLPCNQARLCEGRELWHWKYYLHVTVT